MPSFPFRRSLESDTVWQGVKPPLFVKRRSSLVAAQIAVGSRQTHTIHGCQECQTYHVPPPNRRCAADASSHADAGTECPADCYAGRRKNNACPAGLARCPVARWKVAAHV